MGEGRAEGAARADRRATRRGRRSSRWSSAAGAVRAPRARTAPGGAKRVVPCSVGDGVSVGAGLGQARESRAPKVLGSDRGEPGLLAAPLEGGPCGGGADGTRRGHGGLRKEPNVDGGHQRGDDLFLDLSGYDASEGNLVDSLAVEPCCGVGEFLEAMARRLSVSCRERAQSD